MEPELVNRERFTVMGITARVKPEAADYNDLWDRQFAAREGEVKPRATDEGYYGVYFGTGEPGLVDFVAGMAVAPGEDVPEGLIAREVPAALHAVFECTLSTIGPTWGQVYGDWLPASEFDVDPGGACFEYFPPGPDSPDAPVFIHVPVRERASA
jgi:predicted transcriptional regulator YdeE